MAFTNIRHSQDEYIKRATQSLGTSITSVYCEPSCETIWSICNIATVAKQLVFLGKIVMCNTTHWYTPNLKIHAFLERVKHLNVKCYMYSHWPLVQVWLFSWTIFAGFLLTLIRSSAVVAKLRQGFTHSLFWDARCLNSTINRADVSLDATTITTNTIINNNNNDNNVRAHS